ncbi:MAG: clostripain-related cysteine peptidase [Rikenellaceae bacterium]
MEQVIFMVKGLFYKSLRLIVLSLLLLLVAPSCNKDDGDEIIGDVDSTLIMFYPYSNTLISDSTNNISDMKAVIASGVLDNERVFVCFETSAGSATLYELQYSKGSCKEVTYQTYTEGFTTKEAIETMFNDVVALSPSASYSLLIGCHGMGWLPVYSSSSSQSSAAKSSPAYGYSNDSVTDYEQPHYMATDENGNALTRYFGGTSAAYQIDISTLRDAIADSKIGFFEYLLFDVCYMANIEVAYELRDVIGYLIASSAELMSYGLPYDTIAQCLFGEVDYKGIVDAAYDFYSTYAFPYITLSVIDCRQTEAMAEIMKEINSEYTITSSKLSQVQSMDGYTPTIYYDMGSYVEQLCDDEALLSRFNQQLELLAPSDYKIHTTYYFSGVTYRTYYIKSYSGVTISDPSTNSSKDVTVDKVNTEWYKATH